MEKIRVNQSAFCNMAYKKISRLKTNAEGSKICQTLQANVQIQKFSKPINFETCQICENWQWNKPCGKAEGRTWLDRDVVVVASYQLGGYKKSRSRGSPAFANRTLFKQHENFLSRLDPGVRRRGGQRQEAPSRPGQVVLRTRDRGGSMHRRR